MAQEPSVVSPPKKKGEINPVVALVVIVIVFGGALFFYVSGARMPRLWRGKPITQVAMEKVEATGGDFSKLSKKDRDELDKLTIGNGEKVYKQAAEEYAKMHGKSPKP